MPQNLDQIDHPAEAPQVEELPEPVQIRIEEFIAEEPETARESKAQCQSAI